MRKRTFALLVLAALALLGTGGGKARAQLPTQDKPDAYGDIQSWTTFDIPPINPKTCNISATVNFRKFLAHMSAVRETWLNRDYSADFYRMRGMSTLSYIVAKKVGALMTDMVYNQAKERNPDICNFRIYVLRQDDFGNDQKDLIVSWTFTRELADKINWAKFDDKNFAKVARNYSFGPKVQQLTEEESSLQKPAPAPPAGTGQDIARKNLAVLTGQCRFQLVMGFFPCDAKVAYIQLINGRSMLSFMKDSTVFTVSGGKDRQPNLENYYLSKDTIRISKDNGEEAEDHGMGRRVPFPYEQGGDQVF